MRELKTEVNSAREKEGLIKEYETEKLINAEKSSELHKEIHKLQTEINRLSEMVRKCEADSQASNDLIETLNDEVTPLKLYLILL